MADQTNIPIDIEIDPIIKPVPPIATLVNTPFGDNYEQLSARQIRQEALSTLVYMRNSGSYRNINVNLGAFSKADIIEEEQQLLEENLNGKKNHLLLQISSLTQCNSLEEIEKTSSVKYKDITVQGKYIPALVVTGEQKFPVYATLVQEIDKQGYGAFKTKLGIRNMLLFTDRFEVSYQRAISRHDAHNYGAKWSIPYKNSSHVGLEGSYNFHRLFKGLDHGVSSYNAFYSRPDIKIDLELANRLPHVDTYENQYDLKYVREDYMRPSKKASLRLWKLLYNHIEQGDIQAGDYLDISGEAAVPISKEHASFFRFDLNYRRYWDLCRQTYSSSEIYRKLNRYSNIELAYSMTGILRSTKYVSDCLPALTARGFETQQTPNTSPLNFKLALKCNIYNFPLLSRANIRLFSYLSNSVSFGSNEKFQQSLSNYRPTCRTALGFGAYYELSPAARLELIYNVMQWQNHPANTPTNFQIRIGIND